MAFTTALDISTAPAATNGLNLLMISIGLWGSWRQMACQHPERLSSVPFTVSASEEGVVFALVDSLVTGLTACNLALDPTTGSCDSSGGLQFEVRPGRLLRTLVDRGDCFTACHTGAIAVAADAVPRVFNGADPTGVG